MEEINNEEELHSNELILLKTEVDEFYEKNKDLSNEDYEWEYECFLKKVKKSRSAFERKAIRKFLKMKAPPSELHKGRESIDWTGCPKCKRDSKPHYARGLCSICYRRATRKSEVGKRKGLKKVAY